MSDQISLGERPRDLTIFYKKKDFLTPCPEHIWNSQISLGHVLSFQSIVTHIFNTILMAINGKIK